MRQVSREARRRALLAHALRQDGLKFKEIGEVMGVGPARARSLVMAGERCLRWRYQHIAAALERLQALCKRHGAGVLEFLDSQ